MLVSDLQKIVSACFPFFLSDEVAAEFIENNKLWLDFCFSLDDMTSINILYCKIVGQFPQVVQNYVEK